MPRKRRGNENYQQKTKRWIGKELNGERPVRSTSKRAYALLMGAQIKLSREEFAGDMGQRRNYAAMKDAQLQQSKEECAINMGHRLHTNCARLKDVQIKPNEEECALSMEQNANDAAEKGAQTKSSRGECA